MNDRLDVDDRLEEIELRAWRAFLMAHSRIIRVLDRELHEEGSLSLSNYEVLLHLAHAGDGALRMSDLAASVLLSPSGVSRAVDQLERRGFVVRTVCPSDRRGYLAALTPAGHSALRRASRIHVRGIRDHFTGRVDRAELASLASSLERVVGADASVERSTT